MDIDFLNSALDLKLGILNVGPRLQIFRNSQKDSKMGFFNVALVLLLNFSQFMKE